jgi:hypothetical protein
VDACDRGAGDDQWGCRTGRTGSVVLALIAGALSGSGTFGMLPVGLRGLDGPAVVADRPSGRLRALLKFRAIEKSIAFDRHFPLLAVPSFRRDHERWRWNGIFFQSLDNL